MESLPVPPSTFNDLQVNFSGVITGTKELDVRLVETFTAQLTDANIPPLISTLLPLLITSLEHLTVDPTPVTTLLLRLLRDVPFSVISPDPSQLLRTLQSPSPAIQTLGIEILRKASATPAEVATLGSWPAVVRELVVLGLACSDTGVAMRARGVLFGLLSTDRPVHEAGTGVLWRRVFGDDTVCRQFLDLTSWTGTDLGTSRAKTEAQGRLLELLPGLLELDWDAVARAPGALLNYALRDMVKEKEDLVLHLLLVDFCTKLLAVSAVRAWPLLEESGRAAKILTLALEPDYGSLDGMIDTQLLESTASEFVVAVVKHAPDRLKPELVTRILAVAKGHLDTAKKTGPHSPSLSILTALPTEHLHTAAGLETITSIPLTPLLPDFLRALATLLSRHTTIAKEYISRACSSPDKFWKCLCDTARAPALGDTALAALDVIDNLAQMDVNMVLNAPHVGAMLVEVPQGFVSARAAAGADSEGWAWGVAVRRWEVAKAVSEKAEGDWQLVLMRRVGGGVFGERNRDGGQMSEVGDRVATLEL